MDKPTIWIYIYCPATLAGATHAQFSIYSHHELEHLCHPKYERVYVEEILKFFYLDLFDFCGPCHHFNCKPPSYNFKKEEKKGKKGVHDVTIG